MVSCIVIRIISIYHSRHVFIKIGGIFFSIPVSVDVLPKITFIIGNKMKMIDNKKHCGKDINVEFIHFFDDRKNEYFEEKIKKNGYKQNIQKKCQKFEKIYGET